MQQDCKDKASGEQEAAEETMRNINIRLPVWMVDRIDRLVTPMAGDPQMSVNGQVTRADAIRRMLLDGLPYAERRYPVAAPAPALALAGHVVEDEFDDSNDYSDEPENSPQT